MKKWYLLAGFLHVSLNLLFYTTQDHLHKDDTAYSRWGPLTSIIEKKMPYRLVYSPTEWMSFLNWGPSSWMILAFIRGKKLVSITNIQVSFKSTSSYGFTYSWLLQPATLKFDDILLQIHRLYTYTYMYYCSYVLCNLFSIQVINPK